MREDEVIQSYTHVHDNTIISYVVDIADKRIVLNTTYLNEKINITFIGCEAHSFSHVIHLNMIDRIEKVPIDSYINKHEDDIINDLKYGFPISNPDIEVFRNYIKNNSICVFIISSIIGLSGIVYAKEVVIEVLS
jgi:hypothetical protein